MLPPGRLQSQLVHVAGDHAVRARESRNRPAPGVGDLGQDLSSGSVNVDLQAGAFQFERPGRELPDFPVGRQGHEAVQAQARQADGHAVFLALMPLVYGSVEEPVTVRCPREGPHPAAALMWVGRLLTNRRAAR